MAQQPYVSVSYGASLDTTVTSGYGTINPGPTISDGFMSSTPAFEYLGNASDVSNTAQYTPTVRTLCARSKKRFIEEGTMVAFKGADMPSQYNFKDHKGIYVDLYTKGISGNGFVFKPLASDYDGTVNSAERLDFYAIAVTGVQKVKCDNCEEAACAGEPVFVRMDDANGPVFTFSRQTGKGQLLGYLVLRKTCDDRHMSVCLVP